VISVTTGPPIQHSIPRESCSGAFFFINGDKTKYVSVGAIRRVESMSIILTDEQVYTLTECLHKTHESMCKGEEEQVVKCESGSFRLNTLRSRRGSQNVSRH